MKLQCDLRVLEATPHYNHIQPKQSPSGHRRAAVRNWTFNGSWQLAVHIDSFTLPDRIDQVLSITTIMIDMTNSFVSFAHKMDAANEIMIKH